MAGYRPVPPAYQYTDEDGEITLTAHDNGAEIAIAVRDTGIGIRDEAISRIFERFVRLDEARGRHPEGSGLGLAIVDQVARTHGGRVEVEDRPGGGAIFRVVLPASPPT